MSNVIIQFIRTTVPIIVGPVVAWLAIRGFDLGIDEHAATGFFIWLYWALVTVLAKQWPWVGVLLGHKAEPTYNTE
jgi:hypothetical protein